MGCTGSKASATANIPEEMPHTRSQKEPQQLVAAIDRDNASLCSSPTASVSSTKKRPSASLHISTGKTDSNRSLNSGNEIEDIHVSIPDPFRSQYKVVEDLMEVNGYLKIKKGISRDRKYIRIESTDVTAYNQAGKSDIEYFERLDILRRLDYVSIPAVLDFFDSSGMYRIVMEYASGKDMATLLQDKGPLAPQVSFPSPSPVLP